MGPRMSTASLTLCGLPLPADKTYFPCQHHVLPPWLPRQESPPQPMLESPLARPRYAWLRITSSQRPSAYKISDNYWMKHCFVNKYLSG